MPANREVDLLIAGAGPAGMIAPLVAAIEGLDAPRRFSVALCARRSAMPMQMHT
jgi:flavin-dependent dehydrogenase